MSHTTRASYILQLNRGCTWNLMGTGAAGAWLDGLAAIMGLPRGHLSRYPSIRYIPGPECGETDKPCMGNPDPVKTSRLKEEGWELSDVQCLRLWSHRERPDLLCEVPNTRNEGLVNLTMWISLNPVYERAIRCGGIPIHAALVERSGRAFLLAGNHGVGKTTCCSRLPAEWNALCDDETFVFSSGEEYYCHPIPTWSNYILQHSQKPLEISTKLPLAAIFFLERSAEVGIVPIKTGEAALRINRSASEIYFRRMPGFSAHVRRELRSTIFENACKSAGNIPAYVLRISKTGEFWKAIEGVLDDADL